MYLPQYQHDYNATLLQGMYLCIQKSVLTVETFLKIYTNMTLRTILQSGICRYYCVYSYILTDKMIKLFHMK